MASSMPRLISTSTNQTVRTGRCHAPLTMSFHPSRCVSVIALHCSASSLPAHDRFPAPPFFPLSQPVPRSLDKPAPPQPKWNLFQRAAAAMLDSLEEKVIENVLERGHPLPCTSDPSVQIAGNFSPVCEQPPCHKLSVDGCIPPSINGAYLRNGANPLFKPVAGHHLFDGDGMIHAVRLCNGRASYACRLTETERLRQERAVGRAIFPKAIGDLHGHSGIARLLLFYARSIFHLVDPTKGIGVANAGIIYFNNHFLVMSEDDLPYHIRMTSTGDVDTVGRYDFDGQLKSSMIAHPKIDPQTRELFTLSYDVIKKPFLKYFWFSSSGKKSPDVEIPLPQPTMVHDFAITKNFVVVPDQQIVFKLQEMLRGGSPVVYDETKVCRFGLLPKYATGASEMRWVDVPDCFCFHLWNAWEEEEGNEEVVVIGSCMTPPDSIFNESEKSLQSELTEIRLNLRSRQSTRRAVLGPKEAKMNLEAGMVNRNLLGRKTRFAYLAITEPWPKVSGFAKVDLVTGDVKRFDYGEGRYGGEPYFVPKAGGGNDGSDTSLEDDGHLLSFVHDELTERSELIVVNGVDMTQEAVVRLSSRVPYGFHGTFVNAEELKTQV